MKKLLFSIGFGTLGVVGIATPLLATSCKSSDLENITINTDEILLSSISDDVSYYFYTHNFFGSEQLGFLSSYSDSQPSLLGWTHVGELTDSSVSLSTVVLGKTKDDIDYFVDLGVEDGQWSNADGTKLKKGKTISFTIPPEDEDDLTQNITMKCMLLTNYDEVKNCIGGSI